MRLFIGVRPPESVLDQVAELVAELQGSLRPTGGEGLRWASRDQWHVTLRFLGDIDDSEPVLTALDQAELTRVEARLGPAAEMLGRQVLCLPVGGLETLAAGVGAATARLGQPLDDRRFHAHLTLARLRGRRRGRVARKRDLAEPTIEARWPVGEVVLVRSHPGSGGSRYEDLHVRRLV